MKNAMNMMRKQILSRAAGLGSLLLGCSMLSGCNIVGPAVVLIHGPEKQKALYTIDPDRTMVIFIDDRANRLPRRPLRLTIAKAATDIMLKEGVSKNIIDPAAPLTKISGETSESPMDMVSLGKAVNAQILVYVTIDSFSLSEDGVTVTPTTVMRVKVIDCEKEPARLWPEEPHGKVVIATIPQKQGIRPKSGSDYAKSLDTLSKETGRALAEVFYDHVIQRRVQDNNSRED